MELKLECPVSLFWPFSPEATQALFQDLCEVSGHRPKRSGGGITGITFLRREVVVELADDAREELQDEVRALVQRYRDKDREEVGLPAQ